jgi:hypothetical protein
MPADARRNRPPAAAPNPQPTTPNQPTTNQHPLRLLPDRNIRVLSILRSAQRNAPFWIPGDGAAN